MRVRWAVARLTLVVVVVAGACDKVDEASVEPVVVEKGAGGLDEGPVVTTRAAVEVTVASTPTGATVGLDGAMLGKTPYVLRLKETTRVTVSHDGYVAQVVTAEPDGEPVLVVKLVPLPDAPTAAAPGAEPEEEAGPAGEAEVAPEAADPSEAAEPAAAAPAAPESAPKPPSYRTVTAAKSAYRSGTISRTRYDQIIRKLKARRRTKIERLEQSYRAGRMDKREYKRRRAAIDAAYEG